MAFRKLGQSADKAYCLKGIKALGSTRKIRQQGDCIISRVMFQAISAFNRTPTEREIADAMVQNRKLDTRRVLIINSISK